MCHRTVARDGLDKASTLSLYCDDCCFLSVSQPVGALGTGCWDNYLAVLALARI